MLCECSFLKGEKSLKSLAPYIDNKVHKGKYWDDNNSLPLWSINIVVYKYTRVWENFPWKNGLYRFIWYDHVGYTTNWFTAPTSFSLFRSSNHHARKTLDETGRWSCTVPLSYLWIVACRLMQMLLARLFVGKLPHGTQWLHCQGAIPKDIPTPRSRSAADSKTRCSRSTMPLQMQKEWHGYTSDILCRPAGLYNLYGTGAWYHCKATLACQPGIWLCWRWSRYLISVFWMACMRSLTMVRDVRPISTKNRRILGENACSRCHPWWSHNL